MLLIRHSNFRLALLIKTWKAKVFGNPGLTQNVESRVHNMECAFQRNWSQQSFHWTKVAAILHDLCPFLNAGLQVQDDRRLHRGAKPRPSNHFVKEEKSTCKQELDLHVAKVTSKVVLFKSELSKAQNVCAKIMSKPVIVIHCEFFCVT